MTGKLLWDVYAPFIEKLLWDVYAPFIDSREFGFGRRHETDELWRYLPDLVGFVLVLLGVFLVPRSSSPRNNP
jgi:hypothetical protein